jgi:hypothetical protein
MDSFRHWTTPEQGMSMLGVLPLAFDGSDLKANPCASEQAGGDLGEIGLGTLQLVRERAANVVASVLGQSASAAADSAAFPLAALLWRALACRRLAARHKKHEERRTG